MEQFKADRARAREAGDPMAAVCVLATVDNNGLPDARTLVLRQVEDTLALFMHESSPKWQQIQNTAAIINTYWPSIEIQYRIRFTTRPVDPEVVAASWQFRPDTPKRMDWFYDLEQPQSTVVESREALVQALDNLSVPEPLEAPASARGLLLDPNMIERLDLNELSGLHDRKRYTLINEQWQETVLVP
jgi:pyridoxine/pyridoxamine 5'-phosphate oxidase